MAILRSLYYSIRFRGVMLLSRHTKVRLESNSKVIFSKNGRLTLGLEYHAVANSCVLHLGANSVLSIEGSVSIKKGCLVSLGSNAELFIGDKTFLNENSKIIIYKKCTIGRGCALSYDVIITDSDVHQFESSDIHKDVVIGSNVWVGFRCSITKGALIGNGCTVACNSLVNGVYPSRSLIAGSPAKVIKENISWKR